MSNRNRNRAEEEQLRLEEEWYSQPPCKMQGAACRISFSSERRGGLITTLPYLPLPYRSMTTLKGKIVRMGV